MAEGDDGNGGAQQLNPLETAQLTQIEVLCEKLYTTASMDERLQADKDLESLFRVDGDRLQPEASMQGGIAAMTAASDFRVIGKHEFLLSKSESNYAIHFSSSALLTIVRDEWGNLNTEQRLQLRNFVYSCLAVKGKKLLRFAVNGLITLLVRITKQAWCDDTQYHEIIKGAESMVASGDEDYKWIAFELLKNLVLTMQTVQVVGLRRTGRAESQGFRDTGLRDVFVLTKRELQSIAPDATEIEEGSKSEDILYTALDTALGCLSYDFDTTGGQDEGDGLGIVHVPTAWTDTREETTVGLFFEIYQARLGSDRGGSVALECAGRLANIRRAMFQENQRAMLITRLQRETLNIMSTNQGLGDPDNFHSFCRLLSCLKGNFRLDEIAAQDTYLGWLEALTRFTKKSLAAWDEVEDSSLAYIMSLWGAMVRPITMTWSMYTGMNDLYASARLQNYVPGVLQAFVESRLLLAQAIAQGAIGGEDPLGGDEPPLQFEHVPMLAWFGYKEAAIFMVGLLQSETNALIKAQPMGPDGQPGVAESTLAQGFVLSGDQATAVSVQECRLAWLVHISAGIISGFANNSGAHDTGHDAVNAEFGAAVFRLMIILTPSIVSSNTIALTMQQFSAPQVLAGRLFPSPFRGHLELAFLNFIDQFRRLYADPSAKREGDAQKEHGSYSRRPSWVTRQINRSGAPGSPPARASMDRGAARNTHKMHGHGDSNEGSKMEGTKGSEREETTYAYLANILALEAQPNNTALLDLMISKLFSNIRIWRPQPKQTEATSEAGHAISTKVAGSTLNVLHGMAAGVRLMSGSGPGTPQLYSSGKLLLQSPVLCNLLANADIGGIPYFAEPENGVARTKFFSSIARLLYLKLRETDMDMRYDAFNNFMAPLHRIGEAFATNGFQSEQARLAVIGWVRDLRGVGLATRIREHYDLFYEWLFPNHVKVLHSALVAWNSDAKVTTPILKFFAGIVHNTAHRIVFPSSSAGGIVLFRAASNVIGEYYNVARSRISQGQQVGDMYAHYFKGVMVCLEILTHLLIGGYVNFGIFELYGDQALESARTACLSMCLEGESKDLLAYPKVARSFFSLVEALASKCVHALAVLPSPAFIRLIAFVEVGLRRADDSSSTACGIIDHIVSYRFECLEAVQKQQQNAAESAQGFIRSVGAQAAHKERQDKLIAAAGHFQEHERLDPQMLDRILHSVFKAVVMENCTRQWSMSRPLLPLILSNTQAYDLMTQNIVQSQAPDRQGPLATAFKDLLAGIEMNLLTKNRDTFTKNLYALVRKTK
jgi:hypothetical protein